MKEAMNYTLITKTGKVYTFYILAVAQTYPRSLRRNNHYK
jgi:hypothetical protein